MMFSCPNPGDGLEGVDDSKPIHLPGITCQQFEALLDFLYEGSFFFQVLVPQSSDLESVLDNQSRIPKGFWIFSPFHHSTTLTQLESTQFKPLRKMVA